MDPTGWLTSLEMLRLLRTLEPAPRGLWTLSRLNDLARLGVLRKACQPVPGSALNKESMAPVCYWQVPSMAFLAALAGEYAVLRAGFSSSNDFASEEADLRCAG